MAYIQRKPVALIDLVLFVNATTSDVTVRSYLRIDDAVLIGQCQFFIVSMNR